MWGAAIAVAGQHDGARRVGEQLAEANSALADFQVQLLHQASMARLGQMAAGAVHEMNNPLAVICGRSQMLTLTLPPGNKGHKAAKVIFAEAQRLSNLITSLHMFADAQQLAAAHGGRIKLRSALGKGTTPTMILPMDSPTWKGTFPIIPDRRERTG